jgi:hypothetical protein
MLLQCQRAEPGKRPLGVGGDAVGADGRTILAYGVGYYEGQTKRLYARPSFFLIDKAGIVRGFWGQRPVNPDEIWAPDPLFSSEPILDLAQEIVQRP